MGQSILRDGTTPVRRAMGAGKKACLDHPKGKRVNIPAPGHSRSRPFATLCKMLSRVALRCVCGLYPFFKKNLFFFFLWTFPLPPQSFNVRRLYREEWARGGNVLSLGDVGGGPGKSFLFLLRDELPGTESFGARDSVCKNFRKAPRLQRCPRCRRRPLKIRDESCDLCAGSYPYPHQVSKVNSL
jgi:hypothetical protein